MIRLSLIVLILFFLVSCEDQRIPKPRGYARIELPETNYKTVESDQFSLQILEDADFIIKTDKPNWSSIHYNSLDADLFFTYFKNPDIQTVAEDARKTAFKHAIKADDIINMPFSIPEKQVYGVVYSIEGNAATPVIMLFTDSIDQFVHSALYFNCKPNADSLKPVIHFVRQDIQHIIETLEWKSLNEN